MIPGLPSVPRSPSSPFRSCPPHPTLTFPSLSLKGALERENEIKGNTLLSCWHSLHHVNCRAAK